MATCAPGTRLSAAIFAFSAAERLRRPVGPSITSSRLTRLAFETSNWTSILPSAIMLLPRWSEVSFAPSCHAPHEGISEAHTAVRRCSGFHMLHPTFAIRVPHKESQMIHSTQQLSGSALSRLSGGCVSKARRRLLSWDFGLDWFRAGLHARPH